MKDDNSITVNFIDVDISCGCVSLNQISFSDLIMVHSFHTDIAIKFKLYVVFETK